MIKWMVGLGHREGVSREQLFEKWEHVHIPHVVGFAKPAAYRVTFFEPNVDVGFGDPGDDVDGLAELWFRDWDHFHNTYGDNASPEVGADGFNQYADLRKGFQLFTTETVAVEAETTREQSKLVFFVRRGAGIEQGDLFRHWLDVHMPNVAQAMRSTPGTGRYTVSLADLGRDGPYDGVAELYLDKPDAVLADVKGIKPDGFQELTESGMLALRGHEIRAV